MTNRATTFACLTLAVVVMAGCAGKVHYPDYYMLAIAPSDDPPANDDHKLSAVAVRRFETPAYLRQGRIVYRQTPEQIGFYDYHRWASDPGQVVTGAVMDSVRSAGVFSFVEAYDGQENAEYLLSGRLERLDEVDYKNGIQVEVKLSAQLANRKTGATVWTGGTSTVASVSQREINSVVRAMDQATKEGVEQLVSDMTKQLAATTLTAKAPGVSAGKTGY
ncbi:MAG TPA: ABC-type transport auxiliary lipoprotein family protein [Verrucomicrobiae bacterium]|jgi:ABC-type uncharacterized transport system auxiliary subunit|nr:ABC-type transport auxiliary lipoprotein family protein [Verrucomicrobiae bacterium]